MSRTDTAADVKAQLKDEYARADPDVDSDEFVAASSGGSMCCVM